MTINMKLADDIRTVIGMIPNMHDQENWFYVYGGDRERLTPEDVHVVELLKEAKESEEKGQNYTEFEPTVSCEATLCVAGWACIMNGYTLVSDDEDGYTEVYAEKNGEREEVFKKGQELLGIETEVADWLFCSTTDEQALEALNALAEGELPDEFKDRDSDDYCCYDCDGY